MKQKSNLLKSDTQSIIYLCIWHLGLNTNNNYKNEWIEHGTTIQLPYEYKK